MCTKCAWNRVYGRVGPTSFFRAKCFVALFPLLVVAVFNFHSTPHFFLTEAEVTVVFEYSQAVAPQRIPSVARSEVQKLVQIVTKRI